MKLTKRVRKAVGYLLGFPRTARPAVRAFRVESRVQATHAAREIAAMKLATPLWIETMLAGLLARGGTTLYLHLRGAGPLELVLVPSDEHVVRVEMAGEVGETRVDEVAPEGAYTGPASRDLPLLHHLPQSEPCVAAYGVNAGASRRVVVRFPGFVSHATVAVDSGVFADALPLGGMDAPVVLPIRRASA
ncbi:MAG TPA: hypothetical protein VGR37_00095 [Longimicrobiaceae bacterium]|nr:hypothetical protein [Longimicrobiaceae bacterium]